MDRYDLNQLASTRGLCDALKLGIGYFRDLDILYSYYRSNDEATIPSERGNFPMDSPRQLAGESAIGNDFARDMKKS